MNRRTALGMLAGVPLLGRPARLKITGLEFIKVNGHYDAMAGMDRQHQVNPLHVYDELRPKEYHDSKQPKKASAAVSALYLKLQTDVGVEGIYGPIDNEAAIVVDQQLKTFVIGRDALAGETVWDQMHRSNRHSARGHFMMAISAVDNVLWDVRGRYFEAPVYRLLGGPTRSHAEVYGSSLGFSLEPEAVHKKSRELKQEGFRNQKWFLGYGPGDGSDGLAKNVSLVRGLRDAVGDDVQLMFDAFMGWNLDYAIDWAKQVEKFRPRWIEEAFHVEKIDSFVELHRATSIPIASGEHFYGRWQAHEYLKARAISVVQADPEWCGGVSELVKICNLASLYDAQVIPHGHSIHAALHVVASQSPMTCPLVEYLITKMRSYYHFEKTQLTPVNGKIALPETPGFGIELDPAKIEKQATVRWSPAA